MKIVLLPGLDGTGILFKPFIDALPPDMEVVTISYPNDEKSGYEELTDYVKERLPADEEYVLLAESFSGPIAYRLALQKPVAMQAIVFVASFLEPPQRLVLGLSRLLPRRVLLSLPVPEFLIKSLALGMNASSQLIDLFRLALKTASTDVLIFRLDEIARLNMVKQQCNVKAIYIQASDDYLVPDHCVESFREVMENLTIERVAGPHFILQANPRACVEMLVKCINRDNLAG